MEEEKSIVKRKPRMCAHCKIAPAVPRIRSKRNTNWTEKKQKSFEKCQQAKQLQNEFKRLKRQLVELLTCTNLNEEGMQRRLEVEARIREIGPEIQTYEEQRKAKQALRNQQTYIVVDSLPTIVEESDSSMDEAHFNLSDTELMQQRKKKKRKIPERQVVADFMQLKLTQ